MTWSESSLELNSPPAMLCLQPDVSDPGTLQSVEAAVRENTSLKKMTILLSLGTSQTWTNVAVAILKGAEKNETLRTLGLGLPEEELVVRGGPYPAPDLVDAVRRSNPKLQLTVQVGECESEHVTVGMTVGRVEGLYSTPHGTK